MLLTGAGIFLLLLGFIGIFLPVWPTTPFVLAGAGCLSGTPALRAKILKIPFFKEHIENYQTRTGLSKATLASSLIFLWGMLVFSMVVIAKPWVIALEALVGVSVTLHLLFMARPGRGRKK